jgi:bifunctional DNase/RNase
MEIKVELSKIIINEASDQQVIVLKELDGERNLPIVIGIAEIFAIDRRVKGIRPPRPMTHELIENMIEGLGGKVEKIVINDLRHHTFFATITVDVSGQKRQIDSRPSDAIALSAGTDIPIFVDDIVFEKAVQ